MQSRGAAVRHARRCQCLGGIRQLPVTRFASSSGGHVDFSYEPAGAGTAWTPLNP
jgi:hypothetical protein